MAWSGSGVVTSMSDVRETKPSAHICTQMVGIWCVTVWQQLGRPPTLRLVEMGPGRGTLMADLLRGTKPFAPFAAALQVQSCCSQVQELARAAFTATVVVTGLQFAPTHKWIPDSCRAQHPSITPVQSLHMVRSIPSGTVRLMWASWSSGKVNGTTEQLLAGGSGGGEPSQPAEAVGNPALPPVRRSRDARGVRRLGSAV